MARIIFRRFPSIGQHALLCIKQYVGLGLENKSRKEIILYKIKLDFIFQT
jgi:hypothetical protein